MVAFAGCPSADLSGDCFVDYEDFTMMSGQWLDGYDCNDLTEMANQWLTPDPSVPDDMVYIPGGEFAMGDHFDPEGYDNELPVHAVSVNSFFMGRFEITYQQYCDYLNSALGSGSIYLSGSGVVCGTGNNRGYCDTFGSNHVSQIVYSGGVFTVGTKDGRDMSDDPMVRVSWYGAAAYCNWRSGEEGKESCYNLSTWDCDFSKHGYRLATEAEWEYAARGGEHSPYYRFPWDDTISHSQANYCSTGSPSYDVSPTSGNHPLWNGVYPYTSPVGFFDGTLKNKVDYNWPGSATSYQTTSGANSYGLYGMAGNVWEWCNDRYLGDYYDTSPYNNPTGPASGSSRVLRGGGCIDSAISCRVACRYYYSPDIRYSYHGFRLVLDF
jgi:formylglycine-generating enzyme required for sulfatase activity